MQIWINCIKLGWWVGSNSDQYYMNPVFPWFSSFCIFTFGDGITEKVFIILSGYSSLLISIIFLKKKKLADNIRFLFNLILFMSNVPRPDPVPPPRAWISWNPWKQKKLMSSLTDVSPWMSSLFTQCSHCYLHVITLFNFPPCNFQHTDKQKFKKMFVSKPLIGKMSTVLYSLHRITNCCQRKKIHLTI